MKTTFIAVLVAMMASSNAVSISELISEGMQEGLIQSQVTSSGGSGSDNTAESTVTGQVSGNASSGNGKYVSTMDSQEGSINSRVASRETGAEGESSGQVMWESAQLAESGRAPSYKKGEESEGAPSFVGVDQVSNSKLFGTNEGQGDSTTNVESSGTSNANVGWQVRAYQNSVTQIDGETDVEGDNDNGGGAENDTASAAGEADLENIQTATGKIPSKSRYFSKHGYRY